MCKCNPAIKTPWCGKGDCVNPSSPFNNGGLYRVEKDLEVAFSDSRYKTSDGKVMLRKMIIPKGEILEFRYYSPAHFRDVYNHYFPIHESQYDRLIHVATVLEEVTFTNMADLSDILSLRLYKRVEINARFLPVINPNLKEHFKGVYTYPHL